MIDIIEKFNSESRQALFGCLGDASRRKKAQVTATDIAASFVRVSSVERILTATNIDIGSLLASLGAPERGAGTYERLKEVIDAPTEGDGEISPFPFATGFVTLPLDDEAKRVLTSLRSRFGNVGEETLTAVDVLLTVLEESQCTREHFGKHGVTARLFEEYGLGT